MKRNNFYNFLFQCSKVFQTNPHFLVVRKMTLKVFFCFNPYNGTVVNSFKHLNQASRWGWIKVKQVINFCFTPNTIWFHKIFMSKNRSSCFFKLIIMHPMPWIRRMFILIGILTYLKPKFLYWDVLGFWTTRTLPLHQFHH